MVSAREDSSTAQQPLLLMLTAFPQIDRNHLAPGGTLIAVLCPGREHPANEMELLLFRRWFATVLARQEELPEDTFTESAPPMQSRLIWVVRERVTQ
jgi:hypothetical protein